LVARTSAVNGVHARQARRRQLEDERRARGNATLLRALVTGWKPRRTGQMAVCVPFPYLAQARDVHWRTPIAWGAQDLSHVRAARIPATFRAA
jgi:hypothetical protein